MIRSALVVAMCLLPVLVADTQASLSSLDPAVDRSGGTVAPDPDEGRGYHVRRLDGVLRYAVTLRFDHWPGEEEARALAEEDLEVAYAYRYVPALGVQDTSLTQLRALERLPGLVSIERMPVFVPVLDTSAEAIGARAVLAADGCGRGAVVAVLDTGIDAAHESLDDLDDNPWTDDPKVIASVDLSGASPLAVLPMLGEHVPLGAGGDDAVGAVRVPMGAQLLLDTPAAFAEWLLEEGNDPEEALAGGRLYTSVYHGTHVASVATGTGGTHPEYRGVAPCAELVNVKVLTAAGVATDTADNVFGFDPDFAFGVQAGLEWVLDHNSGLTSLGDPEEDRIDVVNLSLGTSLCDPSNGRTVTETLVDLLFERGIVVAVAAGNCGAGGVTSPGGAVTAVTVGAYDDRGTSAGGDDRVASFSGRGSTCGKPEVLAPGVSIHAAGGVLGSAAFRASSDLGLAYHYDTAAVYEESHTNPGQPVGALSRGRYHSMSGTSMATPHAAGVLALMREASPDASPADLKAGVIFSADRTHVAPADCEDVVGWSEDWGYGGLKAGATPGSTGLPPDVGLLEPQRALRNDPIGFAADNGYRVYAKANTGQLAALRVRVDGGDWTSLAVPHPSDPYTPVEIPPGTPTVEIEATNSAGKSTRVSRTLALAGSIEVNVPKIFSAASDDLFVHLRPGSQATLAAPDGRSLTVAYTPPPTAVAAVAHVTLDGYVVGARDAFDNTPFSRTDIDAWLSTQGDLVGSPADGTWTIVTGSNFLGLPSGIQVRVRGLVFDHVYDAPFCLTSDQFRDSSQEIGDDGNGQLAGDLTSYVKTWNWHVQSELGISRYDTPQPCESSVDFDIESPAHARFLNAAQQTYLEVPA